MLCGDAVRVVPPPEIAEALHHDVAATHGVHATHEGRRAGKLAFGLRIFDVELTNAIGGALFAPSDDDVSSLTIGVVSMTPVTAPTDVATCVFSRSSPGLPHPEDFEVVVDLASDPNGVPTLAAVAIDSITPLP
jgi:hypothetical protein